MESIIDSTTDIPILPPETKSLLSATSYIIISIGRILGYVILYPLAWILWIVQLVLLKPLWFVFKAIASPFVAIGRVGYSILALPFRLLDKFEALFTYLLVAILIGGLSGLILWSLTTLTTRLLGIDPVSSAKRKAQKDSERKATRSVAQFRAEREQKKQQQQTKRRRLKEGLPLVKQESTRIQQQQPLLSLPKRGVSSSSSFAFGDLSLSSPTATAGGSVSGKVSEQTILEEDDTSSATFEY